MAKHTYGARKISQMLQRQGEARATRYRVSRLMGLMGIRPCCPLPSLSAPARESRRFPYLLKGRSILFPNQAWPADIAYVQIGGKHMHLAAITGWLGRCMVSWRLSDTMRAQEVAACAEQAFRDHGTPSVMNSGQGSVSRSEECVPLPASRGISQSMDGRAGWRDDVLMERWSRTLRSECLRQTECSTPQEPRDTIAELVGLCSSRRIHQSLGYDTPEEWCMGGMAEAAWACNGAAAKARDSEGIGLLCLTASANSVLERGPVSIRPSPVFRRSSCALLFH